MNTPDAEGWIAHDGGPCPVRPEHLLCEWRHLESDEVNREMACSMEWGFRMFYRLAQPEPAACEHEIEPPSWSGIYTPPARLARDMTIRERMAMAAMQGILGDSEYSISRRGVTWEGGIAADAVALADALLAAIKETNDDA